MIWFSRFKQTAVNVCTGLTPATTSSNQLMAQVTADNPPKKSTLRKALKQQYAVLQTLRVAMHPDKTFIGKVKKGFDFLRVHLTPTGVTVSDTSLSRHEQKVARLYEQGATKKRIRAYRLRWLAWAVVSGATVATGVAAAPPPVYRYCTRRPAPSR